MSSKVDLLKDYSSSKQFVAENGQVMPIKSGQKPQALRQSLTFFNGFKPSVCSQPSFCHLKTHQKKKPWALPLIAISYFKCLKTFKVDVFLYDRRMAENTLKA